MHINLSLSQQPTHSYTSELLSIDFPFMNTMDEITYWIYTKRAPCLLNYDILAKKQREVAQCSKPKPNSVSPSIPEDQPSPKKKKKRKLTVLDDDSISEKQQKICINNPHQQNKSALSSYQSDSISSSVDFKLKSVSPRHKEKRIKLQKNSRRVNKKNKIVTSTPKVNTTLRRSLRQTQKNLNNNSQFKSSFEAYNCNIINGDESRKLSATKTLDKPTKSSDKASCHNIDIRKDTIISDKIRNETTFNGQFEDLSDVSGFTANYIRSTKIQATKTPRKLNKSRRNLVKESKDSKCDKTIVCLNKSTNPSVALNCSTDSSQNIVNLVTLENTEKNLRVSQSTSVLKFMDSKIEKSKETTTKPKVDNSKLKKNNNQNKGNTPRYPKRNKNTSVVDLPRSLSKNSALKNSKEFNDLHQEDNPEETYFLKTRSGRNLGVSVNQPENSVIVLNNSTEHMSSAITMNVATSAMDNLKGDKKRITPKKCARAKKTVDKSALKTLLREKSGFSACFSDSDDDKPLKPQKFF